jgi:ABC-type nitrate/sulfonate/bicarbonate transport system substrate-binding protein
MTMIARRSALGAAAALLAPGLLTAQTLEPLTVITPFGFQIDFVDFTNAHSGGHFRSQGFASTVLGGTGSASAIQQTVAGRAKFTRIAAIDLLNAVGRQDVPLLCVGTLYQGSTFHVISHRDRPIRTAAELRGKRLGVVSVGGATENFLDMMLAREGIPKSEVPRDTVGNSPGAVALIEQRRIDGFIASINVVAALRHTNAPVEIWSTDRYAPMPGQCWVTTREVAQREPETVVRFLRAMKACVDDLLTTPFGQIIDRLVRDFEVPGARDRVQLEATFNAAKELWFTQGRDNLLRNVPDLWRAGARSLAEAQIVNVASVDDYYTNTFIDRALRG